MSRLTYPCCLSSRITHYQGIIRNVTGDDGSCTNHGIFSNCVATNHCSIGTYTGTFFNQSIFEFILADNGTSGIDYIGEDGTGSKEDIIFANNTCIKRYIILDFYIPPQTNSW